MTNDVCHGARCCSPRAVWSNLATGIGRPGRAVRAQRRVEGEGLRVELVQAAHWPPLVARAGHGRVCRRPDPGPEGGGNRGAPVGALIGALKFAVAMIRRKNHDPALPPQMRPCPAPHAVVVGLSAASLEVTRLPEGESRAK